MKGKDRILVALDVATLSEAEKLASRLLGHVGGFKVGKQLCTAEGAPQVVRRIGEESFLDLKFHDIPKTVAGAADAATRLGVMMFNVHCSGGRKMMQAARQAVDMVAAQTGRRSLVLGVTILTSLDEDALEEIGMPKSTPIEQRVANLAALAYKAGLDGVVCSPKEISAVRKKLADCSFLIVTPGIRKSTDPADDQNRTMTAAEAVTAGADYIVVGRPIIGQPDPVAAADVMAAEIDAAMAPSAV